MSGKRPSARDFRSLTFIDSFKGLAMRRFTVIGLLVCLAVAPSFSYAKGGKGGGSRPSYPGSKHTSSHDGHYKGGQGSSHKGGDYKNTKTNDQYGKHKK